MCNPFGLNIKKNSVMRNKCVFYLLRVIYIIILVILIPILILFFDGAKHLLVLSFLFLANQAIGENEAKICLFDFLQLAKHRVGAGSSIDIARVSNLILIFLLI